MPRKEYNFHYIYKTTNRLNGKYYIGMHSTNNINDGYIGSGDRLRRSIRKYGKENFKFEIIEFLPNRTTLKEREQELITEDLLNDKMCMNICFGGGGGYISPEMFAWLKAHYGLSAGLWAAASGMLAGGILTILIWRDAAPLKNKVQSSQS